MAGAPQTPNHPSAAWGSTIKDIDNFLRQNEAGQAGDVYAGITKAHWKDKASSDRCLGCKQKFSLTFRHHHCRRCGNLFCKKCVGCERRLNDLAHVDPNGRLHKVCDKCFEQGPQSIGFSRSWTNAFMHIKYSTAGSTSNGESFRSHRSTSVISARERLNPQEEYTRIKEGYKSTLSGSVIKRAFRDIAGPIHITTPEWHKSKYIIMYKNCTKCSQCNSDFSLTKQKYYCCVCGVAVCSTCSSKDLIVYYEDGNTDFVNTDPKLAIIKIVGCPAKEPLQCDYLRVCPHCQEVLEKEQVQQYWERETVRATGNDTDSVWEAIDKINTEFRSFQERIEAQMPKYRELIEALDVNAPAAKVLPNSGTQSNIQVLAKAQGDIADNFTQFVFIIHGIKELKPITRGQTSILQKLTRSKVLYYQENMFIFRELKKQLEQTTPEQVLSSIQHIVDRNAINSCYMTIQQIAFETLHLTTKHKLSDSITTLLVQVEQAVIKDLESSVVESGEDWEYHKQCLHDILQISLKKHRLIVPSKRLTTKYGPSYVENFIYERAMRILQQTNLQLNNKCAEKSFPVTKKILKRLKDDVYQLKCDYNTGITKEWVVT